MKSTAQAEALDQRPVALDVDALEVTEQAATLADQEQQAPAAVVVVLVGAGVLGEILDPLGEQRDLHLRGAGVALGRAVFGHDLLLASIGQLHLDKSLVEADTLYATLGKDALAVHVVELVLDRTATAVENQYFHVR